MSADSKPREQQIGKAFLPSLFLSRFTSNPPTIILSLLLVDISLTFGLEVGLTGQINTAYSLVALVASFIVGALSVRFSHKRLLMVGLLLQAFSAVACAVSSSFYSLLLAFSLNGIGLAIVASLTMSITAQHLHGEARANAVGWIIISLPISAIVTSQTANFLTSLGTWQWSFLTVLLPINVLSLLLVTLGVPAATQRGQSPNVSMFQGFTEILTDRSAISCLIGTVFSALSIGGFMVYHVAFFRQHYQISLDFASYMVMGNWLVMAISSWASRRLMRHLGSRRLWALAMVLAGCSIILALIVPDLWVALLFASSVFLQMGFAFTAASNLALDQAPCFSGTFMALFTASNSIGMTIGPFLGGTILLWSNYDTLGFGLGPIGLLAAIIVHFWVHERM